jgi:hypothetical protein
VAYAKYKARVMRELYGEEDSEEEVPARRFM